MYSFEEIAGRRRRGAQAQPPDRGARARQRRRQALRRGRRRRPRARDLRRRRGDRDDRREEGRRSSSCRASATTGASSTRASRAASRPTCWPRPSTRRSGSSAARRWRSCKDAGVRVVPGGDYGFVWCPHGEYAKDIELFVTDMGFSPMEAIVAATKHGSELLRLEHECGTVEEGKCADLLVVDGDPLDDIAILQDRSKLAMVMKDGKVMVNTLGLPQELHRDPGLHDGHRAHPEREGGTPDDADGGGGPALAGRRSLSADAGHRVGSRAPGATPTRRCRGRISSGPDRSATTAREGTGARDHGQRRSDVLRGGRLGPAGRARPRAGRLRPRIWEKRDRRTGGRAPRRRVRPARLRQERAAATGPYSLDDLVADLDGGRSMRSGSRRPPSSATRWRGAIALHTRRATRRRCGRSSASAP